MTGKIEACRTPPEFKEDIENGYVFGLLIGDEYHLMTAADYEKLALDMLFFVNRYRDNLMKNIKSLDKKIYEKCRKRKE